VPAAAAEEEEEDAAAAGEDRAPMESDKLCTGGIPPLPFPFPVCDADTEVAGREEAREPTAAADAVALAAVFPAFLVEVDGEAETEVPRALLTVPLPPAAVLLLSLPSPNPDMIECDRNGKKGKEGGAQNRQSQKVARLVPARLSVC